MPITELCGRAIQIGRALKGWSQRELGERAGIKPWRVWSIENDVLPARPNELAKILKALTTGD